MAADFWIPWVERVPFFVSFALPCRGGKGLSAGLACTGGALLPPPARLGLSQRGRPKLTYGCIASVVLGDGVIRPETLYRRIVAGD
jgi:hypothetical protein